MRRRFKRVSLDELLGGAVNSVAQHFYCDRCGHSRIDGGPITRAVKRIRTKAGDIYLCRHHFHKHGAHILERTYEVSDV